MTNQDVLAEFREALPHAQALLRQGAVEEAHEFLGDLPERLAEHARQCERSGEIALAMEAWALLTDLDPWHAPWWLERGLTAMRDGRDKWARLFLSRALAIDPHLDAAFDALGQLARQQEPRPLPVASVIRSAARRDPRSTRSTLVTAFRDRSIEEVAEAIAEKVSRDGRW